MSRGMAAGEGEGGFDASRKLAPRRLCGLAKTVICPSASVADRAVAE